jgi:hypothetical protein
MRDDLSLIEACDKALCIVAQTREMDRLYRKAVQCFGEGRLRSGIMDLASDAICDETLCSEVFASGQNMVSFFCGIWVQFLLVEMAGMKKTKLKDLALKAFECAIEDKSIH